MYNATAERTTIRARQRGHVGSNLMNTITGTLGTGRIRSNRKTPQQTTRHQLPRRPGTPKQRLRHDGRLHHDRWRRHVQGDLPRYNIHGICNGELPSAVRAVRGKLLCGTLPPGPQSTQPTQPCPQGPRTTEHRHKPSWLEPKSRTTTPHGMSSKPRPIFCPRVR